MDQQNNQVQNELNDQKTQVKAKTTQEDIDKAKNELKEYIANTTAIKNLKDKYKKD